MKQKILFVCLGNICRSPLAEALFTTKVRKKGLMSNFEIDSCGTSNYHEGENADARTRNNALLHGIEIGHRSRPFTVSDFDYWDLILVMDKSNWENIAKLTSRPEHLNKIQLMRAYEPNTSEAKDVPDPWFGGEEGFEEVYQLLDKCTTHLLQSLTTN